jgi:uncharacterized membrane protein YoaK (UPF0700 family)
MSSLIQRADTAASAQEDRHGPLPALLFVLTAVTGLVDAVSYLQLGHVFVANMTGNVVFLGFAAAGAPGFSAAASLVAIAAFLAGAPIAGRLGAHWGRHRGRFIAYATYIQFILLVAALVFSLAVANTSTGGASFFLIGLLAIAMGLQNAAARRLAVPDLTTTVLTLTLTGLAADSRLAGGNGPRPLRRLAATATMCLGAAVGTLLALHFGTSSALAVTTALLAFNVVRAYRFSTSLEPWTVGK